MTNTLLLVAIVAAAGSGLPALLLPRSSDRGQRLAALLHVAAAALAMLAAGLVLAGGGGEEPLCVQLNPLLPQLQFGLDALSALFVLPVGMLAAAVAIYDLGYWRQSQHQDSGRQLRLCLGFMTAGLLAVLAAKDGIAFLLGWEAMALSGFFLVATEHRRPEVRAASWIYLGATHAGTLLLFAFFCCWQQANGSLQLSPLADGQGSPALRDLLFVLALLGFGLKAGIVPLHFWLPPAHAAAPSHVSALMSGVLIKIGVYGLCRTLWLLPSPPAWWGVLLLGLGAASAVLGVAFAIAQHDLKRLLAYHSIENIGIICLGLGTAAVGRSLGRADLVALGLGAALLHVVNHALFKGLLFLAGGAAAHAAGSRALDRLGGMARAMPWTAAAFLCGAVAICGLPPLNGLVSELLAWLGLFALLGERGGAAAAALLAIPALALTGAMALFCFVKVFGIVFLGRPRSAGAAAAREVAPSLRLPMALLGCACLLIGLWPPLAVPALGAVVRQWLPATATPPALLALAPLSAIGRLSLAVLVAAALAFAWLRWRARAADRAQPTWDCGGDASPARIQYTASSFAQPLVDTAGWLLRPGSERPRTGALFPGPAQFARHVVDPVLDRALLPLLRGLAAACSWLRLLQRGNVQLYLLYVFLTLLVLLLLR